MAHPSSLFVIVLWLTCISLDGVYIIVDIYRTNDMVREHVCDKSHIPFQEWSGTLETQHTAHDDVW